MTDSSPSHTTTNSVSLNTTQSVQHTDSENNTAPAHIRQPTIQPQPNDLLFGDTLWDQFELVYQRVTRGRHDLKKFQSYMDSRITIERTYAKALQKAADSNLHELEAPSPDFIECYNDVKNSALSTSKTHEDTAILCTQISAQLKECINELKTSKTRLKDQYEKLVKDKTAKRQAHDKARDTYLQSVKQAEDNVAVRDQSRGKVAEKKYVKLDENVRDSIKKVEEQTHISYKRSVDILLESQRKFDSDIVVMLNEFQRIETQRLQQFQAVMTNFANIYSASAKLYESIFAQTSKNLAQIDIRNDVQSFIKQFQTQQQREPYVQYIPQRSTIIGHAVDTSAGTSVQNGVQNTFVNTPVNNNVNAVPIQPSAPVTPANNQAMYNSGAAAIAASAVVGSPNTSTSDLQALALYDFAPNEPDELPFKQGDVITLVKYNDSEDWWQGSINGRVGLFPKNYVAKQNPSTKQFVDTNGQTHNAGSATAVNTATAEPVTVTNTTAAATTSSNDVEQPKLMNATCTSLYDFDGQDADELTFKAGQKLLITGELNGWYLGRLQDDTRIGIFPSNYVSVDK